MNERVDSPSGEIEPPTRPGRFRHRTIVAAGLVSTLAGLAVIVEAIRKQQPMASKPDLAREAGDDLEKRNFRPLSEPLAQLLSDPEFQPVPTQSHPLLGQKAPDFTLTNVEGKMVSLHESLTRGPVVLVFYYGYHCNHCVSQLFALNKDFDKFEELGATVLAVSADPGDLTMERYKQYGAFRFPVLADSGNIVAGKYATFDPPKKVGDEGNLLHGTFVINRQGMIVWANRGDEPFVENRTLLFRLSEP